jgi:hypothetical protein
MRWRWLGVVAVMREAVPVLLDAEMLRHEIAADLQRGDAGAVRLQGERDHLIQQRQILDRVAIRRLIEGCFRLRLVRPALAQFQALLHIAHGGEIFVELVLVLLVHLLREAVRLIQHGVEDGCLHLILLRTTSLTLLRVGDEKFFKQLRRIRHRRHTHARLRPRDLAAAMNAALRPDRE